MSFADPLWLLALALIPLALAAAAAARSREKRYAVRFPAVASAQLAATAVPVWRRHLPAALALAALALLVVALAKPRHEVRVAVEQASIVLVTDHSRSMLAEDVQPDRITAAKQAANSFIDQLPGAVRVGVVAFSGAPDAVRPPSTQHDLARAVIDGQLADGPTATGDALQVAIDLLRRRGRHPAAIVLLSDGATTTGRDPLPVAERAGRLHIPIYTVALGTSDALVPNVDPTGPLLQAAPDPETLRLISRASRARAFTAEDAGSLSSIYKRLGSQLGTRVQRKEITASFAAAGLVLLLGAGLASLRGAGRLP